MSSASAFTLSFLLANMIHKATPLADLPSVQFIRVTFERVV